MTRTEAQHLIDTYCNDEPTDGAVERLIAHEASEFDGLNEPGGDAQDALDTVLYG